jgi:hypothetical protein
MRYKQKIANVLLFAVVASMATAAYTQDAQSDAIPFRLLHVAFFSPNGLPAGTADVEVTNVPAKSCLGSIGDGYAVRILTHTKLENGLIQDTAPIVFVHGDKLSIDWTGMCDAYQFLSGAITADGANGTVASFGWGMPGKDLGTFRARKAF